VAAVENLSWLAKAVDGEEGHNCFSIGAARRENAVGRVLSPAPISPVSLGAGGKDGRHAQVVWLRKSQVPALGFASASTSSHRVVALAARGRRAWPPESACAPPGRSRYCSAACDPGPPYGFAECSARNPRFVSGSTARWASAASCGWRRKRRFQSGTYTCWRYAFAVGKSFAPTCRNPFTSRSWAV